MALIKVTVDRKTMRVLNEEVIDTEAKPDYEPLARLIAEKIMKEVKSNEQLRIARESK